jgi:transketolase
MTSFNEATIFQLEMYARAIRKNVILMLGEAGSGHLGGSLGATDILAVLYGYILQHNAEDPKWEERDRLILSYGHIAPALYSALALLGYFEKDTLKSLRSLLSPLQGHPERTKLPCIETTSGPLGDGLGQAIGIALALKMDKKENMVYALLSDGEQQCGVVWESLLSAQKHKLDNLIICIDRNGLQIGGNTEDIIPLSPLREKYEAFNFHTLEVDGNDIPMLIDAFENAKGYKKGPTIIIAHTIMGKGVKEIERNHLWHGKAPSKEQAEKWQKEIMQGYEDIFSLK